LTSVHELMLAILIDRHPADRIFMRALRVVLHTLRSSMAAAATRIATRWFDRLTSRTTGSDAAATFAVVTGADVEAADAAGTLPIPMTRLALT
jgi:hypothetical protein